MFLPVGISGERATPAGWNDRNLCYGGGCVKRGKNLDSFEASAALGLFPGMVVLKRASKLALHGIACI